MQLFLSLITKMSAEIDHLQYWLQNLKKDARLTPQQFFAMEKAILLAISTFENVQTYGIMIDFAATNSETNEEEPMDIDL